MPYKPKVHRPAGYRTRGQRRADDDKARGTSHERGYDAQWRAIRKVVIAEEPLCRHCLLIGRTTATQEVDHIMPHKGDRAQFVRRDNLQGLCKQCHSRKTATEDSGFARQASPPITP